MTTAATTVLYIAGTGRSGSTVLANVLGEADGAFAAGEVRYLWDRGIAQDRLCGCGARFSECQVWQRVLAEAFAGDVPPAERIMGLQRASSRLRHAPRLVASRWLPADVTPPQEYIDALARLYPAMAHVTGARVVVDSSKLPAYAAVLRHVPGIDLRVVHLVRDPRAAAHSWQRRKALPDRGAGAIMEQQGPVKSTVLWDLWNTTAESLFGAGAYLRLRYEDFAAEPRAAVERILTFAGLDPGAVRFDGDRTVELHANHSVAGNPNRLQHGAVQLRPDTEWQSKLPGRTSAVVAGLSAPLLVHYGYTVRAAAAGAGPSATRAADVQHLSAARRLGKRLQRHWQWGRTQGFGRLIEEDQLDPVARMRTSVERARFRRDHGVAPGEAIPVFVVGLQRSGTNMLTRGFDTDPAFEVHNENDRAAFDRFMLREEAARNLVLRSRHTHVLFKPLCDSHRIGDLLDDFGTPRHGRAIWAFRGVDGRARSAVAKFGDNNRVVLREIAAGRGLDRWQAQRLSERTLDDIRSFDWDALGAEDGAAMFWLARNRLYFEQRLDERDDVMLSSYAALVREPRERMRAVCDFLRTPFTPSLCAHITGGRGGSARADLHPRVRELCEELEARLEDAASAQAARRAAA